MHITLAGDKRMRQRSELVQSSPLWPHGRECPVCIVPARGHLQLARRWVESVCPSPWQTCKTLNGAKPKPGESTGDLHVPRNHGRMVAALARLVFGNLLFFVAKKRFVILGV